MLLLPLQISLNYLPIKQELYWLDWTDVTYVGRLVDVCAADDKGGNSLFVELIILAKITKYQNKIFAVESKMKVKMIFEWFLMTTSK